MTSQILEAVRFTPNAETEIRRLAKQLRSTRGLEAPGTSVEDVEAEIIDFVLRGSHSNPGDAVITVSEEDVITFEIATNVFKAAIFYFDPNAQDEGSKFVRIVGDEIGAPKTAQNEDDLERALDADEADDDDDQEDDDSRERAAEKEAEDDEDDEEEDDLAQDIGHSEASALRQKGSAVVKKTITMSDGKVKTINLNPVARLYHLSPRSAVIRHTISLLETKASPIVNRAIDAKKTGRELYDATASQLISLFDNLREETCLTDSEINAIQTTLLSALNSTSPGSEPREIKKQIRELVQASTTRALRHRQDTSRVLDYLSRTGNVTSPDEQLQIQHGLAANNMIKTRNALESFLSTRNITVSRASAQSAYAFGATRRSSADVKTMMLSSAGAQLGTSITGREEYTPDNFRNTSANQIENEAEKAIIDRIAEEEGSSDFSVFPTLLWKDFNREHQAVSVKIRSGDTSNTVHNVIRDMADFERADKRNAKFRQHHTSGAMIFREIVAVISKIDAASLGDAETVEYVTSCKEMRDGIELLSGLVEYLAMSGLDVLPQGEETARSSLISVSEELHAHALRITDDIVRAETLRDNRRSKATISADISKKTQQLSDADAAVTDKETELSTSDLTKDQREKIKAALKEQTARKTRIERELSALRHELLSNSTVVISEELRGKAKAELKKIDLQKIKEECEKYVPSTRVDEQENSDKRDKSRYTIQLANTRVSRINSLERSQKGDLTSIMTAGDGPAVAFLQMNGALERYERQVHDTMQKLTSHNQIQLHALLPIDTINSICDQYRVGVNPRAEDIVVGFVFSATLPKQFVPDGLSINRTYTVNKIVTAEKKARNPDVEVQYVDPTTHDVNRFNVPRRAIVVALSTRNEQATRARAREQFAQELRFSAIPALREISRQVDRGGDQMASLDEDKPLIPQIANFLYSSDMTLCQRRVRQGIEGIKDSMEDALLPEELAPDPSAGTVINDRLARALRVLAILSKRIGQGRQFASAVADALGQATSMPGEDATRRSTLANQVNIITLASTDSADRFPEEDGIVGSFLQDLAEMGRRERNDIAALIQSVNESLSFMASAQSDMLTVENKKRDGEYEDALVGLQIPVPPRGILVPGATVTVVPPRRTMGRFSRRAAKMLGVTPSMQLSAPLMGIVSSIEYVAFSKALIPMLDAASEDMSKQMLDRMMSIYDGDASPRLSSAQEASGMSACRDALQNFLMSPINPSADDYLKAEHQAVLQTYRKISSIVGRAEIGVISPENMSAMDETALAAESAILSLQRAAFDGVARSVTSDAGVRKLYAVAPCTAVMLNRLAFNVSQMRLFNILEPTTETALTTMTADFFREAMSGIQRGKTGGRPIIFSREIDRIAVAMRVLSDFYTDFKVEAEKMDSLELAVIERLRRKYATPGMKPADVLARVATALGMPGTVRTIDDLKPGARDAAQKIAQEMALLSDADPAGKLMKVLREIADESVGTVRQLIPARIEAESTYEKCIKAVQAWIDSAPVITRKDAESVVNSSPREAVHFGVPQILESISESAANAVFPKYNAARQTNPRAVRPER